MGNPNSCYTNNICTFIHQPVYDRSNYVLLDESGIHWLDEERTYEVPHQADPSWIDDNTPWYERSIYDQNKNSIHDSIESSEIPVGMAVSYNNDGEIILNSGSFSHRSSRFTPYRFCDSTKDSDDFRFTFRYGPKYSKTNIQGKHKYDDDSYKNTVAYSDLVIATFNVAHMKDYTPTYLESLVLTKYLAEEGNLPPANNEL